MFDVRGSMLKKEKLQIPMTQTKGNAGVFSSLFPFSFYLFPLYFSSTFTDLVYLFNFELRTSNFEPTFYYV